MRGAHAIAERAANMALDEDPECADAYTVLGQINHELDRYEEVPELYLRVEREIGGQRAFIYVLRPEHADGRPAIASGDWTRR